METQNIEYKREWNDEYIKWICGFANSQGGKIYIGIINDTINDTINDSINDSINAITFKRKY